MNSIFIRKIVQKDNDAFSIDWTDGLSHDYRLAELQENCPCAACQESGKKPFVKHDVKAVRIQNVGKYALRVQYTSGCSNGIYSFEYLRALKKGDQR